MIIKYRTSRKSTQIEEVVVDRETENSVWLGGSRNAKVSNWAQYHETYELAYSHLHLVYSQKLEVAEIRLERAKTNLADVELLKR